MESAPRKLVAILAADIVGYSALMSADEERTVNDLKGHQAVVLPMLAEYAGHLIDTAGDGIMAEFSSVVNAVECGLAIQSVMAKRNVNIDDQRRMRFRMGINVGDVIFDAERIYGDGINIAARLEGIAEPGEIYVSRQVVDQVEGKVPFRFRSLGEKILKNIPKPVTVFTVDQTTDEDAFVANVLPDLKQDIKYCRTADGVRLAYATVGNGPTLVKVANYMNHLEYDFDSPITRHLVLGLAAQHQLLRYDARGNGMSDWDVENLSLEAWVTDLETVVDTFGLDRFPLLGISQGSAVAVAYAVRNPERVSHLILYGGFALGAAKRSPEGKEIQSALKTLTQAGWGSDSSALRQMFTSQFAPDATQEQAESFNELQRRTTSPECAARYMDAVGNIDVTDLLPQVTTPTLVMHTRGDVRVPFEVGRQLAQIPNARFIALQGNNHLLLENTPATERFLEEVELFLES